MCGFLIKAYFGVSKEKAYRTSAEADVCKVRYPAFENLEYTASDG